MSVVAPLRWRATTASQLQHFAHALAPVLRAGDVLVLVGDLGAGKTTFTRGLGQALGVLGEVTSPTFALVHEHAAATKDGVGLVHVDAYRTHGRYGLEDLDLADVLDHAILVVEWGRGRVDDLTNNPLELEIVARENMNQDDLGFEGELLDTAPREVTIRWADQRRDQLVELLQPWQVSHDT